MLWANFAEIDMVKLKKNPGIRRVDCIALAVLKMTIFLLMLNISRICCSWNFSKIRSAYFMHRNFKWYCTLQISCNSRLKIDIFFAAFIKVTNFLTHFYLHYFQTMYYSEFSTAHCYCALDENEIIILYSKVSNKRTVFDNRTGHRALCSEGR